MGFFFGGGAETQMSQNQIPSGNFHVHTVSRPVARHNRYFGGLSILCKHIFPCIKIMKNSCHDFQSIQIDKQHYGYKRNVNICVICDLPATFSYTLGLYYGIL